MENNDKPTSPPIDRPPEYPFTEWQKQLEEAYRQLKGRPKFCGLNAFRGLRRSWLIAAIDPEISVFRAVTAEEEAATALIFALKHRQYPGSEKLHHRSHKHKAGIAIFLQMMKEFIVGLNIRSIGAEITYVDGMPRIDVQLPLPEGFAKPDEPLNLVGHKLDESTLKILRFEDQLQSYADKRGAPDFRKACEEEANLRNLLLYATDVGLNVVSNVDYSLVFRGRSTSLLLSLAICVLQTPMHQLFVVQAIEAFLGALNSLPDDLFDFDTALRERSAS